MARLRPFQYQCESCNNFAQLSFFPDATQYPRQLRCPHCGQVQILASARQVGPQPKQMSDKIWLCEVEPERTAEEAPVVQRSFAKKLDDLALTLLAAGKFVEALEQDIMELSEAMRFDFKVALGAIRDLANIDKEEIAAFLHAPISMLPVAALDADVSRYTAVAICPRFIDANIGFKVTTCGAHSLNLVTPYSIMVDEQHANRSSLLEFLKVRKGLNLQIIGSKIVGDDLDLVWESIPGVSQDMDHTQYAPSIVIVNSVKARAWLASNGVRVAQTCSIPLELVCKERSSEIMSLRQRLAFEKLCHSGRLLLCWDRYNALDFTNKLVDCYKQRILVVTKSDGVDEMQAEIRQEEYSTVRLRHEDPQRIVFCDRETACNSIDNLLGQFQLIVVDLQEESDCPSALRLLEALICYNGALLVLGTEPVMDTLDDNLLASRVYSVCNAVMEDWGGSNTSDASDLQSLPATTAAVLEAVFKSRKSRASGDKKAE